MFKRYCLREEEYHYFFVQTQAIFIMFDQDYTKRYQYLLYL
jgi:hypothetical protein